MAWSLRLVLSVKKGEQSILKSCSGHEHRPETSFWQPSEARRTLKGTVRQWLLTLESLPPGPSWLMLHLYITHFGQQGHRLFAKRKPCSEEVQCGPQSSNKTKQSSISKLGWGPWAHQFSPLIFCLWEPWGVFCICPELFRTHLEQGPGPGQGWLVLTASVSHRFLTQDSPKPPLHGGPRIGIFINLPGNLEDLEI